MNHISKHGHQLSRRVLRDALGTPVSIRNIGTLRQDGRRKNDQAPGTSNIGNVATMKKAQVTARAKTIKTLETLRSQLKNAAGWRHHDIQQRINLLEAQLQAKTEAAVAVFPKHMATADLEVDTSTVPWLLTYAHMLKTDEDTSNEIVDEHYSARLHEIS